jgi:hypothetical protein
MQAQKSHAAFAVFLLQWLNRILEEVWPFYDAGMSKIIKVGTGLPQELCTGGLCQGHADDKLLGFFTTYAAPLCPRGLVKKEFPSWYNHPLLFSRPKKLA